MVAKKTAAPKYEDESLYDVILARPITVGRTIVRPAAKAVRLKGKVVADNEADIIEATKVPESE